VPQDRWPFINWLIIIAAVTAFVFQTMSIKEQRAKLPAKMSEYENRPIEDMAKDFGVSEKRLKKIEERAEKAVNELKNTLPSSTIPAQFKEKLIKKAILNEYFVWAKVRPFVLDGLNIKGLFGHIWLHGGILHLLGNMLFLWIFGNAVCAKIGNLRYIPIYLGLGLIAALTQIIITGGKTVGASGAINGIVGMYLVFFPMNDITCYYFISIYPREFTLSSIWMILFWLVFDIWGAASGGGTVAYFAHLGGFAGGFVIAISMLKLKLITMERYEQSLLQVIAEHKNPPQETSRPKYVAILPKESKSESLATNPPEQTIPRALKPIPLEPQMPKEEFIRFTCSCGKRLKMPAKYAGRIGRCPYCNARLKIPNQK
jgi:membrane associated rhomboid family serine protease